MDPDKVEAARKARKEFDDLLVKVLLNALWIVVVVIVVGVAWVKLN